MTSSFSRSLVECLGLPAAYSSPEEESPITVESFWLTPVLREITQPVEKASGRRRRRQGRLQMQFTGVLVSGRSTITCRRMRADLAALVRPGGSHRAHGAPTQWRPTIA